ncbi:MAG TPA: PQQ-dependent sugar dehydrogenase [Dehalococcoidia bacterium]|nr:PQQ-dependent sugar dehydrogenase [Dehalococcoidia bacterium]
MPGTRICLYAAALAAVLLLSIRATPASAVDLVSLQPLASGLTQPTSIAHAGDARLFITQKNGVVRVWDGSTLLPLPFLNISGIISTDNEDGLLSIAFHPDYASNGRFFIDYVNAAGDIVIAEYAVSGDPNVADPLSGTPVLTITHQPANSHNGGQIAFGPDGYLYISVGDGSLNQGAQAQDTTNAFGTILRIDVDGGVPYAVPVDNPFAGPGDPGLDEIWVYGLRNPWRFSFDRLTGDLFIGDVGEQVTEEVDLVPASSTGGENFGWPITEGSNCFNPPVGCDTSGLTSPIIEYGHGNGDCSVTGGYRYRGAQPYFYGKYIYADFCSGRIWAATEGTGDWTSQLLVDPAFLIATMGEGADGELYVGGFSTGTLYRISALDTDADTIPDGADNCLSIANPGQENADANFFDQTPPLALDDATWINSDDLGDACDSDDDNDGIADATETAGAPCASAAGPTDPLRLDGDGDRFTDGAECALATDPASAASPPPAMPPGDTDGDGLPDAFEGNIGTSPADPDTDNDGLRDGVEYRHYGSSPLSVDTDGDACPDLKEAASIDSNMTVGASDLGLIASAFGNYGPLVDAGEEWRWNADVDKNGAVGASDLGLAATAFGACA